MKLSLVLLLVVASVALFKAEDVPEDIQELTNDEGESPVSFLYDGSMEDEVMGDEEDPADKAKKRAALKHLGDRRICGGVFIKCLKKTKARCKLVPVCKVKYFACRCIIKGIRKCKKFLHFVSVMAKKHGHKHDEVSQDEEDPKKKRRVPAFVKVCKAGYRRCSRGKKFCGKCLKAFGACIRKHIKKHKKKGDEAEEDEETIMADAVENHEDESEDGDEEFEDPAKKKRRPNKKILRCARFGVKCMLRARLNCRRQGRCVRILMKCVRRARPRPSKQ